MANTDPDITSLETNKSNEDVSTPQEEQNSNDRVVDMADLPSVISTPSSSSKTEIQISTSLPSSEISIQTSPPSTTSTTKDEEVVFIASASLMNSKPKIQASTPSSPPKDPKITCVCRCKHACSCQCKQSAQIPRSALNDQPGAPAHEKPRERRNGFSHHIPREAKLVVESQDVSGEWVSVEVKTRVRTSVRQARESLAWLEMGWEEWSKEDEKKGALGGVEVGDGLKSWEEQAEGKGGKEKKQVYAKKEANAEKKKSAVQTTEKSIAKAADVGSETKKKTNWNEPSAINPFGSLLSARYKNNTTSLPFSIQMRYYAHDKVQDELRHEWRRRAEGQTGADVARAYLARLPKEVTSEPWELKKRLGMVEREELRAWEQMVRRKDMDLTQLKGMWATRFAERCEGRGW